MRIKYWYSLGQNEFPKKWNVEKVTLLYFNRRADTSGRPSAQELCTKFGIIEFHAVLFRNGHVIHYHNCSIFCANKLFVLWKFFWNTLRYRVKLWWYFLSTTLVKTLCLVPSIALKGNSIIPTDYIIISYNIVLFITRYAQILKANLPLICFLACVAVRFII